MMGPDVTIMMFQDDGVNRYNHLYEKTLAMMRDDAYMWHADLEDAIPFREVPNGKYDCINDATLAAERHHYNVIVSRLEAVCYTSEFFDPSAIKDDGCLYTYRGLNAAGRRDGLEQPEPLRWILLDAVADQKTYGQCIIYRLVPEYKIKLKPDLEFIG